MFGGGRYPAHAHPQRAAALVLMRTASPPVCVGGRWTSVDVAVRATGCCRGATTDGSAHTRGRQDQPNDKDQWARVSADTVLTTGCNPWVLTIALRPSSRQSTTPAALGQWGVAGLLGPAGDCTPAIEAVNAPEAQWTGLVRRHGPVQPPGYTHRRPIDGASIARSSCAG